MLVKDQYTQVEAILQIKGIDLSKPHKVTIEPYDPKHTAAQRKTYWMWLDEIVKEGGGTGNRYGLDEEMRKKFVKRTTYTKINGEVSDFQKSVSQLGKKELSHLMSEVWVIAHEFGFTLKDPEGYRHAHR